MGKMTYEIITKIKESEKGSVYLAAVQGYDFPLIVKQMKHDNEVVLQKLKEIDNLHIPKLYHYEKTRDGVLLFEEYIEGELLSDYLRNNVLTDEEQLKLAIQLCEAEERQDVAACIWISAFHRRYEPFVSRWRRQ